MQRTGILIIVCLCLLILAQGAPVPTDSDKTQSHKYTNQLIKATSPYLLQHAHNPVDWYPWGPEALERAKREDKPIFLSIGYAACHWCHVMERESFENEEIAAIMNRHFINIKVDREERPDLDEVYMSAVQLMTGQGGWPMSVFLTPALKPFFGGTYFPPEDRYGRPGFKRVLTSIAGAWQEQRDQIEQQSEKLVSAIRSIGTGAAAAGAIDRSAIAAAIEQWKSNFDSDQGGFGGAPKFPPSMAIDLLMRQYKRTGQTQLLEMVELTLRKMARGGMYDQLGGGFHRYSTDARWLVPHFEKMLYDNALLVPVYLDAYQITGDAFYAGVARETLDWVLREMRHPQGGFYSTLDADSEGEEGKFYVWSRRQIEEHLPERDAELFAGYYDLTKGGNWEGHNILNVPRSLAAVAKLNKTSEAELLQSLTASKAQLLAVRSRRIWPLLDDKVLTAWNGLMISAMARGYAVLGDERYRDAAVDAAQFIRDQLQRDGRLLVSYRDGQAHLMAYLDDYAFLVAGLIDLYEVTGNYDYLTEAKRLTDTAIEHYLDGEPTSAGQGFFFVADDHERLIARTKNPYDNAIPSGNSVMALDLVRLAKFYDREDYYQKATGILKTFAPLAQRSPTGLAHMLCAVETYLDGGREIVVVGPSDSPQRRALLKTVWRFYLPNKLVAPFDPQADGADAFAPLGLFTAKGLIGDQPTAYVCRNYACQQPVTTPDKLADQLKQ